MHVRQLYGVFGLALGAFAAAQGQAQPITLRAAIARALTTHPDIRLAVADVGAAKGEVTTARVWRRIPRSHSSLDRRATAIRRLETCSGASRNRSSSEANVAGAHGVLKLASMPRNSA